MSHVKVHGLNPYQYGPNFAIGPSLDEYTGLHQDGRGGDMDSLHLNLAGYNEIIFFPVELTWEQKATVFSFLNSFPTPSSKSDLKSYKTSMHRRQFYEPHTASEYYYKRFPTKNQLEQLKNEKNIDYKCFILKPGELLWINAGRLHIFRKMGNMELPKTDPFYEIRKSYLNQSDDYVLRWNVSLAWDFLYTGFKRKAILPLATIKWQNSLNAAHCFFGSQGCIEVPLMILLMKYGEISMVDREEKEMIHINVLLRELVPLFFAIIKYQGDKIPITRNTGEGKIISCNTNERYKSLRDQFDKNSLMDIRCDSCDFHLSNHFLTCRACLSIGDYPVNVCTTCFALYTSKELSNITQSKIHPHFRPTKEQNDDSTCCKCTINPSLPIYKSKCHRLDLFKDTDYSFDHFLTEKICKKLSKQINSRRNENSEICRNCKVSCFKCQPSSCNCHRCFELVHIWATEEEVRRIYWANKKSKKNTNVISKVLPLATYSLYN